MSHENDFQIWKTVLESAECIEDFTQKGLMTKKLLAEFLEGLEARTQTQSDPVENLELFVVRRLCQSVRHSLEKLS